MIDIGTKAKCWFAEQLDMTRDKKKFSQNCLEAFQAIATHLKLKLPWSSTILKNIAFLYPERKGDKESFNQL